MNENTFVDSFFFYINLTVSFFLGGGPTSICHFFYLSVHPSVRPSIHCAAYLRNRTSSDHNFQYTYVKWWCLKDFFPFFQNFGFLGWFFAPYLRNRTSSDHNFWYTYVKWWYLQVVFWYFFLIFIFWAVRGVKGQKRALNEK